MDYNSDINIFKGEITLLFSPKLNIKINDKYNTEKGQYQYGDIISFLIKGVEGIDYIFKIERKKLKIRALKFIIIEKKLQRLELNEAYTEYLV